MICANVFLQIRKMKVFLWTTIKAAGEDNNAKLIAAYFNHIGLEAKYVCPKKAGLTRQQSS